jgi:hypothetical protein
MGSDSELNTYGDMFLAERLDDVALDKRMADELPGIAWRMAVMFFEEEKIYNVENIEIFVTKSDVLCTMPYYGDDGVYAAAHSDKPHYHAGWKAQVPQK